MEIDIKRLREQFRIPWNRKFIVVKDKNRIEMNGRYWSGGTKDEYYILRFGRNSIRVPDSPYPNPEDMYSNWDIEENTAILKLGSFCGKPATPVLYLREGDGYIPDKKTIERAY